VVGCNNLRHSGRCNKLLYLLDLRAEYLLLLLLPLFPSKNIPTLHECHRYFFYPIPIPSPSPPLPPFATASWGGSINGPFVRDLKRTPRSTAETILLAFAPTHKATSSFQWISKSPPTRASVVILWYSLSPSKLLRYINCMSSLRLRDSIRTRSIVGMCLKRNRKGTTYELDTRN